MDLQSNRTFPAAFWLMVCFLIAAIIRQLWVAFSWGHDSYQMTEWLIDYSGGFVRRGLPGTLVGAMSDATGIRANHLVIAISLICFLALITWLLRRAAPTFPAVLILSCVVMGIPAYQDSIVRKDCLGLLFLVGCLRAERSRLPPAAVMTVINLLAGVAILCHESFVFYALAGLIIFNRGNRQAHEWTSLLRRGFSLIPAGICFLLAVIYHGTPEQAVAVNQTWTELWRTIDPSDPSVTKPDASIEALGWTTSQGLSLSLHMLTTGFYQPAAWATVFTVSLALVVLFTGRDADNEEAMKVRIRFTALLLQQLVFISPLFLLGVDYGRWLFLWVAGSMVFHCSGLRASAWAESAVGRVFEAARLPRIIGRVPACDWYLLIFGVPVCWNAHNFLTASPLGRHIHIIQSWF